MVVVSAILAMFGLAVLVSFVRYPAKPVETAIPLFVNLVTGTYTSYRLLIPVSARPVGQRLPVS
jgi:hypothetical protein